VIVVVGAGIAGLSAAHELRRRGREVVVLEAATRVGGVIHSERVDGYLCEDAAGSMIAGPAVELARSLGVDLVPAAVKKRWIFRHGALRAVPARPAELVTTSLLSWRGKARLLLEPFAPPARGEETVAELGRRRLGPEATEALLKPFVVGIYAGDAERLSVADALPRVKRLEEEHGSLLRAAAGARRGETGSFAPRDGMEALPRALAEALGDAVVPGARVESLAPGKVTAAGRVWEAETIVVTTPSTPLLQTVDPALARLAATVPWVDVTVVHVALPRAEVPGPLDGFGFLVAEGEMVRALGCVFESSVWPDRAPEGYVLLRLLYGGARDPAAAALSDAALAGVVAGDLRAGAADGALASGDPAAGHRARTHARRGGGAGAGARDRAGRKCLARRRRGGLRRRRGAGGRRLRGLTTPARRASAPAHRVAVGSPAGPAPL
jgi:oxygen-dependent protoporphyrinogen oxidase